MSLKQDHVNFVESHLKVTKGKPDARRFVQDFVEQFKGNYNSVNVQISGLKETFAIVFPNMNLDTITDEMRTAQLIGKAPSVVPMKNGRKLYGYKIWNIDANTPIRVSGSAKETVSNQINKLLGRETSEQSRDKLIALGVPRDKVATLDLDACETLLAWIDQNPNLVNGAPTSAPAKGKKA